MASKYSPEQQEAVFWSSIKVGDADECWEWQRAHHPKGYGTFLWRGRFVRAHRLAFLLSGGFLADGECVCHTCDNPACCNPKHLFAGTQKKNIDDCVRKGRLARGERNGIAKLCAADVIAIRRAYKGGESQTQIAERHGLDQSCVSYIVRGKTWKHIPL